ncbi:histone-lysine N-methyltransferase, H3 lysine-9 specific SUVH5 isoform X2 [Cajanus cajan]|uniref:histone-lysine N-methyltransferase, H3 lysine-9 specific SUVH5 isoform X2 n=1 Tax=Cajanus cajan TaxID=3821 RepID=UPI0010FB99EE|nr:histone-lysine N-methyltransferase, H3 lysine-9 specific SUVH5 isoform X2 [Cajanus cajan]
MVDSWWNYCWFELALAGRYAAFVDFQVPCCSNSNITEMDASKSSGKRKQLSSIPSYIKKWEEMSVRRRKVKQALEMFCNLHHELMVQYEASQLGNFKSKSELLIRTAMCMKRDNQWENTQKRVGHVLGIEVGDQFRYRVELNIIGLHKQFSNGIDYMGRGRNSLATSIVVTNRYSNIRKSRDTLVYIGHGGNPNNTWYSVSACDQKLSQGNLALKNSMHAKCPVRVILKVREKSDGVEYCSSRRSHCLFVYDGLYLVTNMTHEKGTHRNFVFKFTLNRILEQPQSCVALKDDVTGNADNSKNFESFTSRKRHKSGGSAVQKNVIRVSDISNGKEKFPVRVVTSVTCVQLPPTFHYIVQNIYLNKFKQTILQGCDCGDACVNSEKCPCIAKNGGRMPYDSKRTLVSPMDSSLIYECGPSCKCFSSCTNRVTQHGIQFQLEIFMTELKGWGVRTRSYIPSGSFVCEYIGEVSKDKEAGSRLGFSDYIFDMGVGKDFIDGTKSGNIGRFINHSCSPNLHAKNIVYNHNDKNLPHKMLFAVKDIPAGRELSYDYRSSKRNYFRVRNITCYCRSQNCNSLIHF